MDFPIIWVFPPSLSEESERRNSTTEYIRRARPLQLVLLKIHTKRPSEAQAITLALLAQMEAASREMPVALQLANTALESVMAG